MALHPNINNFFLLLPKTSFGCKAMHGFIKFWLKSDKKTRNEILLLALVKKKRKERKKEIDRLAILYDENMSIEYNQQLVETNI